MLILAGHTDEHRDPRVRERSAHGSGMATNCCDQPTAHAKLALGRALPRVATFKSGSFALASRRQSKRGVRVKVEKIRTPASRPNVSGAKVRQPASTVERRLALPVRQMARVVVPLGMAKLQVRRDRIGPEC
jgi:hypothetical protein